MGKKILVVDDEKPIRELLRYKLSGQGFEVITAKNEKEFRSHAFEQKPDLIILDIWLKDKIGTDIYNDLLNLGLDAAVPVVFITALVQDYPKGSSDSIDTSRKKYVLYSKPFDFEKLVKEINCLLNLAV